MKHLYVLRGHEPMAVTGPFQWAKEFYQRDPHVAKTVIGDITISTVFLGIDHRFGAEGPPLLFETFVFGGWDHGSCLRSSTWDEAEAYHEFLCARTRLQAT